MGRPLAAKGPSGALVGRAHSEQSLRSGESRRESRPTAGLVVGPLRDCIAQRPQMTGVVTPARGMVTPASSRPL